ncbi:uncharacterized protein LOC129768206 [Toxorhynchites rutilus septentrionalis]|uniref:uncharacterized protein LOC129768206 n=1 Tax=Toxorhynchites rutilus septentrionalis TaxID=329112 RepID=UPI00247AB83B|nr:uncharacterized protein LOC129768206 [Toxorhynchites rutilus septentrionalis]
MFKLVIFVGVLLLVASVDAQQRQNGTMEATTIITTDGASSNAGSENSEAAQPTTETNSRLGDTLRLEIERRRNERQQRIEQNRNNLRVVLEDMSDRRREYELRRRERQRSWEEMRTERQKEMEARRVGRLPEREQLRLNRLRLEQVTQNDADNEVTGGEGEVEVIEDPLDMIDVFRNIVLIEEASGNVRLVDLGTEEGRDLASRVVDRMEDVPETQQVLRKLILKMGQL